MVLETNGNANRFLRLGPPSTGGSHCTLRQPLLYDVIPDRGRLYRPPSLLSEGFKAQICIASFTPLSNHLCSTSSILVFSNMMVWSGLSVCMCFETSDVVELGLLRSPNLAFSERSVSPTYVASHSSQLILYTGPTTLSFPTGSFGWTNSWRRVFVGLKYVGIPYPPKVLFSSSEKPLKLCKLSEHFLSCDNG